MGPEPESPRSGVDRLLRLALCHLGADGASSMDHPAGHPAAGAAPSSASVGAWPSQAAPWDVDPAFAQAIALRLAEGPHAARLALGGWPASRPPPHSRAAAAPGVDEVDAAVLAAARRAAADAGIPAALDQAGLAPSAGPTDQVRHAAAEERVARSAPPPQPQADAAHAR